MRSITGSADGRIFMGGHDGMLYEFVYEPSSLIHVLGFKRKCHKVERSGSTAAKWLIPSFIRNFVSRGWHSISQICIDHERSLLYTLADDTSGYSSIVAYNLSSRDNQYSKESITVYPICSPQSVKTLFDKFLVEQSISVKQAGMTKGDYGLQGADGDPSCFVGCSAL